MNPLVQAIENNNIHQLKLLLDLGHDPNKETANENFPWLKSDPLSKAHSANNIGCAEVLLKAGANPKTIINGVIETMAFKWCDLIIEYLDSKELNRLIKAALNKRNVRVLELVVEKNPEIKKIFVPEMLCDAVMRKQHHIDKFLIDIGVNINTPNENNATPLLYAANNNLVDIARVLIDKGANINFCNDYNITPLIEAAKNNATEVAFLLLENGADIHIVDWEGFTALDHARHRENTKLIFEIEKYLNN